MPRGRKYYTLDEQLENTKNEIERTNSLLNELRNKKKDLEEQLQQRELQRLYEIILSSGKSLDEVEELLGSADCAGTDSAQNESSEYAC